MAKEMKTLGGYEIVDKKAREDIEILKNKEDSTKELEEKVEEALSLAKGATKAFVYDTYEDMISELNQLDKAELLVNYHIMIREVCVPDLWVSDISDEYVEYTYTSNEDFIADLTEDGIVQVGYFVLSALETQKVDLSEYVKKDDYATNDNAGLIKVSKSYGFLLDNNGYLATDSPNDNEINNKSGNHILKVPHIDKIVKSGLINCKEEWTEEQKQLARALLGSVGFNDYATADKVGLVKVSRSGGATVNNEGRLVLDSAGRAEIDLRQNYRNPIVPKNLDYAVKKALSDCKLEGDDAWTEKEKASALELLGGVDKKYVDDLVGSVETILTELHTYAQTKIGGEA